MRHASTAVTITCTRQSFDQINSLFVFSRSERLRRQTWSNAFYLPLECADNLLLLPQAAAACQRSWKVRPAAVCRRALFFFLVFAPAAAGETSFAWGFLLWHATQQKKPRRIKSMHKSAAAAAAARLATLATALTHIQAESQKGLFFLSWFLCVFSVLSFMVHCAIAAGT